MGAAALLASIPLSFPFCALSEIHRGLFSKRNERMSPSSPTHFRFSYYLKTVYDSSSCDVLWHLLYGPLLLTSIYIYPIRYSIPVIRLAGRSDLHPLWRCLLDSFDCSRYSSPRLTPKSNLKSSSKRLKFVAGRVLDRDDRVIAKAQDFPIDRVGGDDLSTFPIKHARLRTHKCSIIICASLIATYGWILRARVVKRPFRNDWSSQLTRLAHSSTSRPPIFDRILQPGSLQCKSPVRVQETRN